MSDDSGPSIDFSPTDFIVGLSSIYVLLNYSAFLAWAASLAAPMSGLATIIVYLFIIVGVIEVVALAIVGIVLVIGLAIAVLKGISWVANR